MKVYDCFIFNNEIELLEIRLNILDDYVDKFIITEGDKTFSGNSKESVYLKNKNKFSKWEHKIIYNHITIPNCDSPWDREIYSRNSVINLNIFEDSDIILTSDLDEIPNPEVLKYKEDWINDDGHFTFQQNCYVYYLNNFNTKNWFGTRAATYKYLKTTSVDNIRESTEDESKITKYIITNGGWHFSYIGNIDTIKNKIESFSHQEYNIDEVKNNIEKNLIENTDILFRHWIKYEKVDIDETFPQYIIDNQKKYRHLIK